MGHIHHHLKAYFTQNDKIVKIHIHKPKIHLSTWTLFPKSIGVFCSNWNSSNSLLLLLKLMINTKFDYLRISVMPNHHNTTSSKINRENGVHTLCLEESSIRNITIVGKSTRGRPHLRLVGPHRTTRHTRTTASISNTTESFWGRRRTWGARLHVNSIVSVGKKIIFVCKWRARPSVSSGFVHLGGGRGRGGRWGP